MKRLIILTLLVSLSFLTKGQKLTKYNDFFISKIPEFKTWLYHSNLNNVLIFDTITVKDNKVNLLLRISENNKLRDKANFFILSETLQKTHKKSVSRIIFDKFLFLMDLKKGQAEINIDSRDAFIDIWYENNELIIDVLDKMGEVADGHKIRIKALKGINKNKDITSTETINIIKSKLKRELRKEYEKFEATFENYNFTILSELDNELIIEIDNVVKLIIQDESYFEHISINFQFSTDNNNVKIDYVIRAKYGAGIIWSPKNSDYYDITPEYQIELEKFNIKLKNQINNILTNK